MSAGVAAAAVQFVAAVVHLAVAFLLHFGFQFVEISDSAAVVVKESVVDAALTDVVKVADVVAVVSDLLVAAVALAVE